MSRIIVTRAVGAPLDADCEADEHRMTITVKPVQDVWCVECGEGICHLMFRTGGAAERGAVRLAAAFARCGRDVRVIVRDRFGVLAGSLEVSPTREMLHRALFTTGYDDWIIPEA